MLRGMSDIKAIANSMIVGYVGTGTLSKSHIANVEGKLTPIFVKAVL